MMNSKVSTHDWHVYLRLHYVEQSKSYSISVFFWVLAWIATNWVTENDNFALSLFMRPWDINEMHWAKIKMSEGLFPLETQGASVSHLSASGWNSLFEDESFHSSCHGHPFALSLSFLFSLSKSPSKLLWVSLLRTCFSAFSTQ